MSSGDMSAVQPGQRLQSPSSTYSVLEFIGEGYFGKVAKCRKLPSKEKVAVKILNKDLDFTVDFEKEMSIYSIMSVLKPDVSNVVRFYECFSHMGWTCLAFEMLEKNLYDLLADRHWKNMSLKEIRPIAKQLLVALDALKGIGILHTDIKPDNIMVVNVQEQPIRVKLIDFGEAITASQIKTGLELQATGYRAPEIALGLPFTEAIDAWGIGCVLAFLFLAGNLFPVECQYQMMKCMVAVLGQPEDQQLRAGVYTKYFFIEEESTEGPAWRLLTPDEFTAANGWEAQERVSVIELPSSLDALVNLYPKDEDAELQDSRAFVDLLKGLLHLDGDQRISPQKALQLPFVTMTHLQEHPDGTEYLTTSEAMMSRKPQLPNDEDPDPWASDEEKPCPLYDEDPDPWASDEETPCPLYDKDPDPWASDEETPTPCPLYDKDPDPWASDEETPTPCPLYDKDPDPWASDEEKPCPLYDEDPDPWASDEETPCPLYDKDPDPWASDEETPTPCPLYDKDPDPWASDEETPTPCPLYDKDPDPWASDEETPCPLYDKDPDPWASDEETPCPLYDKDPDPWASDEETPCPLYDKDPDPWASDEETPCPLYDKAPDPWASDEETPFPLYDENPDPWLSDGEIPPQLSDEDLNEDQDQLPPHTSAEDSRSWASIEAPCNNNGDPAVTTSEEVLIAGPSASSGSSKKSFKRIRRFFKRIKDAFCCCCRAED